MTDLEKWQKMCEWAVVPHRITVDWYSLFLDGGIAVTVTLAVG